MKTLSTLTRDVLIQSTRTLVAEEKRLELELLDHLREIDRRQLHLEMGFQSLYDFATRYLGLSEASAYRRISAMRVIREIPEVKTAVASGKLSLTNVAAAQTFFRAEKKQGKKRSVEQKKELLVQLEGLSKRECERKLLEISPETRPQEKQRAITPELTELKLVVDGETMALLQELKNAHPQATTAELLKRALQESVRQVCDARAPKFAPVQMSPSHAEDRRRTFARAQNRCEYVSLEGKRCDSTHSLEIDHKTPRALGGAAMMQTTSGYCVAPTMGLRRRGSWVRKRCCPISRT